MAVRSIKLKLVTGGEKGRDIRKALWNTHRLFNEGVAYYLRWLLLLRQEKVPGAGIEDPESELYDAIRKAWKKNGYRGAKNKKAVLEECRKLYELVVPSSVGGKGDAQSLARKYLSPLVDPKSVGGLGESKSGRKPRWQKLREKGDPGWKEAKERYEERKKKDGKEILTRLKNDLKVLPLFPSFSEYKRVWRKGSIRNVCTTWDRDMFQQAIERLLSWESWNRRVEETHKKLEEKFENARNRHMNPEPEWAKALSKYEKSRKAALDEFSFASDKPYRILPRATRGWTRLSEKWMKEKDTSQANLWRIASALQTELRGGFGDPDLFRWLSREENHWIWQEDPKRISIYASINQAQLKLEEAKQQANFTSPDPSLHPLWVRHDGLGGNLHKYRISSNGDGKFLVELSLLFDEGGEIVEKKVSITLAHSDQFSRASVHGFDDVPKSIKDTIPPQANNERSQWVRWEDLGTRQVFWGRLGGSKIQFDRATLERFSRKKVKVADGNTGPIFFNLTLDLVPLISNRDSIAKCFALFKPDDTSPFMAHDYKDEELANISLETSAPGIGGLHRGLRVMSVDMGTRAFASCSVFELVSKKPAGKLAFRVADTNLWAVHRRSFVLPLDGEKPDRETEQRRKSIREERLVLRAAVRRLSRLLSLAGRSGEDRKERFVDLQRGTEGSEPERRKQVDEILDPGLLDTLESFLNATDAVWQKKILEVHSRWESSLGRAFSRWRKKGKAFSESKYGIGGISYWWLEELLETRRLINSWSLHARKPGEIVRARSIFEDRKDKNARMADTDRRLLEHINNLKEDRIKKGADQLVMAALGYVYEGRHRRWVAKYPPCRLILFEDLSRYRFRTDRPRRENSQLMKWSHRAIPKTVAMQGDLFGILVGTVVAGFTSRFHAASGAPGIRAHVVTEEDLDNYWFVRDCLNYLVRRKRISEEEKNALLVSSNKSEQLRRLLPPGKLVPFRGGELFVTLSGNNKPIVIHADINAAQNLQARFWTRYSEPVRLSCSTVKIEGSEDEEIYVPRYLGKRLERALGGSGILKKASTAGESFVWERKSKAWLKKNLGKAISEEQEEESDVEGDLTELQLLTGETRTFFRDPSGVFFRKDLWYPSELFWSVVADRISEVLFPDN